MNSFEPRVPGRLVCSVPSELRFPGNYIETQVPDEESRRCFCFRSSRDSPRPGRVVISVTQRNFGRRVALPSWPETRLFCFAFAPGSPRISIPKDPGPLYYPAASDARFPTFVNFAFRIYPLTAAVLAAADVTRIEARLPGRMIIAAATEILSFLATGDGPTPGEW